MVTTTKIALEAHMPRLSKIHPAEEYIPVLTVMTVW